MADPTAPDTPLSDLGDLPIQPTGSGVADLEIAYEQMKLAEDAAANQTRTLSSPGEEDAESAARPS
jgi:hypothetical protein